MQGSWAIGVVSQRVVLLQWGKEMNGAGGCCVFLESSRPDGLCPMSHVPTATCQVTVSTAGKSRPWSCPDPILGEWRGTAQGSSLGEDVVAPRVGLAGTQGLWGQSGAGCSNTAFREEGLLGGTRRDGRI